MPAPRRLDHANVPRARSSILHSPPGRCDRDGERPAIITHVPARGQPMDRPSETYSLLGAGGVPGLGELYVLLFGFGTAAALIPAVSCFRGMRGRTPLIWRPVIYALAVLVGA